MRFFCLSLFVMVWTPPALANETCPAGESIQSRFTVIKASRLENIYASDRTVSVQENVYEPSDEWVTIPPEYEWIDKPVDYVAPKKISIRTITDSSGHLHCSGHFERSQFNGSDKITLLDGTTKNITAQFKGAPVYKNKCEISGKKDPIMEEKIILYDPEYWEKDNSLRVLKSPVRTSIRPKPQITRTVTRKPKLIGKIRHPAELKRLDENCRLKQRTRPDLRMAKVPITTWSVIYLKDYEELSRELGAGLKPVGEPYNLSDTILTTSIDPKSLDVVWHVFDACNPVGNHAIDEATGEPRLDASGNRIWSGKAVLQVACTQRYIDPVKNKIVEKVAGRGLAERLFETKIGPNKTYHIVDLSSGILIWYNEAGDEIARFNRIDETDF